MIISDLNYQETVVEATNLEGGFDIGLSLTQYTQNLNAFQTASFSGPGGSAAHTTALNLDINSIGIGFVGLDLP